MDDSGEFITTKPNRRKRLSLKTHVVEVGSPPPSGVHELSRKEKERLEKKKLEELLRK